MPLISAAGQRVANVPTLAVYALAHAAVDAVCAGLLWAAVYDGAISAKTAWTAFFLYNFLAFAIQPLVGIVVDRSDTPRRSAVVGGLVTAAAMPLALAPHGFFVAVVLAGLGNAVFHVGGGVVSLRFRPGKAWPPALFVAPGAAGLAGGIALGRTGGPVWLVTAGLVALMAILSALPAPRSRDAQTASAREATGLGLETAILLLLLVIGVRSYVGMTMAFPWKGQAALLVGLTAGVVAGKALGGVLADRYGWRVIGVGALLAAPPLLVLGTDSAAFGIAGALVFNLTMPVTLVAVAYALPGHEGFAFGLTCLALFIGAAPALAGWGPALSATPLILLSGCAAVALWWGLGRPTSAASSSHEAPCGIDAERSYG